ncbi:hypothetical protein [Streptomyces sp. NEAU-174]|uniref:hypothetical protein n=1 Tax=Streptomyces sp. NEAU-174 TaxID=3458254 RepID=UPI00404443F4
MIQTTADGSRVQAYSLDTGKVAWTFTPKALASARTGVFVQSAGGSERVLLARQGKTGDEGLGKASKAISIDILSADSPAKAPATHHLDLLAPQDASASFVATDTGFLIGSDDNGVSSQATVIDSATGRQRTVKASMARIRDCESGTCTAEASPAFATSVGVVSAFQQTSGCDQWGNGGTACTTGFRTGDSWTSTAVAPAGMNTGIPLAATGQYLIAAWHKNHTQTDQPALAEDQKTLFAVHDLSDGRVLASVPCTSADSLTLQPGAAQTSTLLGPGGRFLVSGQVGFDLKKRKGRCYTSTSNSKGIDLSAIGGDGTAYGVVHTSDGTDATGLYGRLPIVADGANIPRRDTARVDLSDGKATALPSAAVVPMYLAADGHGVFRTRDVLAVYPRG